jgi:hypothetical protein
MKAIDFIAPRVIRRTSYSAHHTEKRGPPELPAGQNRPEHGSFHALLSTRFAQARANHCHDSSTEEYCPPNRRVSQACRFSRAFFCRLAGWFLKTAVVTVTRR